MQALLNLSLSLSSHCDCTADDMQVSNYFAPTEKAKQEGYNAYLTDKNAERLATALCRMRGAALKLGQMLSIQDEGVLPPQVRHCAFKNDFYCRNDVSELNRRFGIEKSLNHLYNVETRFLCPQTFLTSDF